MSIPPPCDGDRARAARVPVAVPQDPATPRWLLDRHAVPRLAEVQSQVLKTASAGVKKGGSLVYSVCTITPAETSGVISEFLEKNPQFQLDPFPHPLTGEVTDGRLTIWPQDADTDAMFVARMIRT